MMSYEIVIFERSTLSGEIIKKKKNLNYDQMVVAQMATNDE